MHKEIQSIQFLRAIACLLVVIFHISFVEQKYSAYNFIPAIGQYGVDLFFVISGFILTYLARFGESGKFLLKRAWRIYPAYWQFTLIVLLVWIIQPEWVNSSYTEQPSIIKSLLLWPQTSPPILAVGWSLIFEMYFYLVFALVLASKRYSVPIFASWAAITAALYTLAPSSPIWAIVSSPLAFEFMAGCVVAWAVRSGYRASPYLLLVASVIWVSVIPGRALCFGPAFALLIWACIEAEKTTTFPKFIRSIGDASYSIYLSHVLVISAIGRLWAEVSIPGMIPHIMWLLALMVGSVTFGIMNYLFVEKPLLNLPSLYRKRGGHPSSCAAYGESSGII